MELPEVEEQIVRCTIERVTFHNPDNGWTVLHVAVIDRRKKLTVVGTMSNPRRTVGTLGGCAIIAAPELRVCTALVEAGFASPCNVASSRLAACGALLMAAEMRA